MTPSKNPTTITLIATCLALLLTLTGCESELEAELSKPPSTSAVSALAEAPLGDAEKTLNDLDDRTKTRWRKYLNESLSKLHSQMANTGEFCEAVVRFDAGGVLPTENEDVQQPCSEYVAAQQELRKVEKRNSELSADYDKLKAEYRRAQKRIDDLEKELEERIAEGREDSILLRGQIVQKLGDHEYEIASPGGRPFTRGGSSRGILRTRDTVYDSKGAFAHYVENTTETRTVTLQNGFSEERMVFTAIDLSDAKKVEKELEAAKSEFEEIKKRFFEAEEPDTEDTAPLKRRAKKALAEVRRALGAESDATESANSTAGCTSSLDCPDGKICRNGRRE